MTKRIPTHARGRSGLLGTHDELGARSRGRGWARGAAAAAVTATVFVACLLRAAPSAATEPANPNAGPAAREVYRYLQTLGARAERTVVSGQLAGTGNTALPLDHPGNEVLRTFEATGAWVGLYGLRYDYPGGYQLDSPRQYETDTLNEYALEYWRRGGLVTIGVTFTNPGSRNEGHRGEYGDMDEILLSVVGSRSANERIEFLYDEYDRVADGLEALRDLGVAVIFRPYHEMTGDWFWWGVVDPPGDLAKRRADFRQLYRELFEYMTYQRGLDNLLWEFTIAANAAEDPTPWYPGDDVVDIIALAFYGDPAEPTDKQLANYAALRALGTVPFAGKPVAFGELGQKGASIGDFDLVRVADGLAVHFSEVAYFQQWRNQHGLYSNPNADLLLADPRTINLDDLRHRPRDGDVVTLVSTDDARRLEVLAPELVAWSDTSAVGPGQRLTLRRPGDDVVALVAAAPGSEDARLLGVSAEDDFRVRADLPLGVGSATTFLLESGELADFALRSPFNGRYAAAGADDVMRANVAEPHDADPARLVNLSHPLPGDLVSIVLAESDLAIEPGAASAMRASGTPGHYHTRLRLTDAGDGAVTVLHLGTQRSLRVAADETHTLFADAVDEDAASRFSLEPAGIGHWRLRSSGLYARVSSGATLRVDGHTPAEAAMFALWNEQPTPYGDSLQLRVSDGSGFLRVRKKQVELGAVGSAFSFQPTPGGVQLLGPNGTPLAATERDGGRIEYDRKRFQNGSYEPLQLRFRIVAGPSGTFVLHSDYLERYLVLGTEDGVLRAGAESPASATPLAWDR